MESQDDKTMGMLCHLVALSGYMTGIGMILGPLLVWLFKKDGSKFVDYHGKESLNFQITVIIASIVAGILTLVLIGFLLIPVIVVCHVVFTIIASIKANAGERYRYPLCIRIIK